MPPPTLPGRAVKRRRKGAQMTIEDVLSRGKLLRTSSPATSAAASSPTNMRLASTPTTSSPIPISDDSDSDSDLPVRRARASKSKQVVDVKDNDDDPNNDDEEDDVRPAKRRRQAVAKTKSDSDGSETEADDDVVRPAKRIQAAKKQSKNDKSSDSDSDSDDVVITTPQNKRSRLVRNASSPVSSAAKRSGVRSAPRSARSEKQRHMELLRRRRMGEKITESDLESELSDVDEEVTPRAALYDKDPNHVALSDFEDDEDEEEEAEEEEEEDEDDKTKQKRLKKEEKKREKEKKKKEKEKKKEKKKSAQDSQSSEIIQLRSKFDDDEEDDGYDYNGGQADSDDENNAVGSDAEEDDDMADFIDDTKLGVLGAPDGSDAEDEEAMLRREIPLQFTFQAHKPLQSHFKDAVEWLVHRRLHESITDGSTLADTFTEADDELYRVAWDRLDREVGGLAQSRFISSVWTPEFYSALRARPYMDSFNIRPSGGGGSRSRAISRLLLPGAEENICHACGRTNHPASFQVTFSGKAYYSRTLDDVEDDRDSDRDSDRDRDSGSGSDNDSDFEAKDDKKDKDKDGCIDMNGNPIAPTSRRWMVGATCHSNAETAHDLLHWRRALKDWVEEKMQADRLLDDVKKREEKDRRKKEKNKKNENDEKNKEGGKKEKKREEKRMRKLREFGYKVADEWEANGTINSLFRDFKKMLEAAQVKSTQTTSRFGR